MANRFNAVINEPLTLSYSYYENNILTNPHLVEKVELFKVDPLLPGVTSLIEVVPSGDITNPSTGVFNYTVGPVAEPGTYFDRITILPDPPATINFTATVSYNLSLDPANWDGTKHTDVPTQFDGYTLQDGDVVLLFGQLNPEENGLFIYDLANEELTRDPSFDSAGEINKNDIIEVTEGSSRGGNKYRISVEPTTINTDPIRFQLYKDARFIDEIQFQVSEVDTTITGTVQPSVVPVCRVFGSVIYPNGQPVKGSPVVANAGRFPSRLNSTDYAISQQTKTTFTDPSGSFFIDIPQGLEVRFVIREILFDSYVKIPVADSVNLFSLSELREVGDVTNDVSTGEDVSW